MERNRTGIGFIVIGIIFIAAAIGWAAMNLYTERQAGESASAVMDQLAAQLPETRTEDSSLSPSHHRLPYKINPDMAMPIVMIDGRGYIGQLELPSLEMTFPVIAEWDYVNLKIAPCKYVGSVYTDDMIICGHNYDTHFGGLQDMKLGDPVIFTDMAGNVFRYKVSEQLVLQPGQIVEMITSEDWDLTLFTCTLGGMSRVTVRCVKDTGLQPGGVQ